MFAFMEKFLNSKRRISFEGELTLLFSYFRGGEYDLIKRLTWYRYKWWKVTQGELYIIIFMNRLMNHLLMIHILWEGIQECFLNFQGDKFLRGSSTQLEKFWCRTSNAKKQSIFKIFDEIKFEILSESFHSPDFCKQNSNWIFEGEKY
jgi:hypothetical protein